MTVVPTTSVVRASSPLMTVMAVTAAATPATTRKARTRRMKRFTSGRRLAVEPSLEDHGGGHLVPPFPALPGLHAALDHEPLALDGGEPLVVELDLPSGLLFEPGTEVPDPVGLLSFLAFR